MISRRDFVKTSAILSAGIFATPELFAADKKYIGLQLYTIRNAMQADAAAALAKVAAIGYNSVEGATYSGSEKFYGLDALSFSKLLKQNGLEMQSGHYALGEEKTNPGSIITGWEKAVDEAAKVGLKYMVCAYLNPAERGSLDHYKKLAADFNKAGEICAKAGIQFCYHNHDFEFIQQDGKYPYESLLANTDKNLVKMEMDIYWVVKAKQDPIALINNNPGRFPLWHVKDLDSTPQASFTEVGSGVIDFKKIFKEAKKSGMKYFFVEQDRTPGDPFESITKSFNYIKANLV